MWQSFIPAIPSLAPSFAVSVVFPITFILFVVGTILNSNDVGFTFIYVIYFYFCAFLFVLLRLFRRTYTRAFVVYFYSFIASIVVFFVYWWIFFIVFIVIYSLLYSILCPVVVLNVRYNDGVGLSVLFS